MWRYWTRVHREAWRRARASLSLASLITLLAAIASLGVLVSGIASFSAGTMNDALLKVGVPILTLILIYSYWVAGIPSDWDTEKSSELDSLRQHQKPKILLMSEMNGTFWRSTNITENGPQTSVAICIGVKNESDQPIRNASVQIERFSTPTGHFMERLKRPLRMRDRGSYKFDIAPRKTEFVCVARFDMDKKPEPSLEFEVEDKARSDSFGPGTYQIQVVAYADNTMPIAASFEIHAHANGCSFGRRHT